MVGFFLFICYENWLKFALFGIWLNNGICVNFKIIYLFYFCDFVIYSGKNGFGMGFMGIFRWVDRVFLLGFILVGMWWIWLWNGICPNNSAEIKNRFLRDFSVGEGNRVEVILKWKS